MTVSATDTLRSALVGAWHLQSYQALGLDGTDLLEPLGDHPEGIIMYTPDGYMSATMMNPDRPPFSVSDPHQAPDDELAAAAGGYMSYAGPFTVDGDVVAHHVEVSLMPNWIDGVQYRRAELDDSTLVLRPTEPIRMGGKLRNATLVWQRR